MPGSVGTHRPVDTADGQSDRLGTRRRPLILMTNDDGIRSPGLLAAAEAICDLGELLIVAPATQQTGMGRSTPPLAGSVLTVEHLTVRCDDVEVYALTNSPAQAVIYGVLGIASRRPDLVISGINHGENLGTAVTASGTLGGALQAAEFGIPALAVSLETDKVFHYNHSHDIDWSAAAHFTRVFAESILREQLPFDVDVLKVDVPADASPRTPWKLTRQSRQPYYVSLPPPQRTAGAGRAAAGHLAGSGGMVLTDLDYQVRIDWLTLEPDSDIAAFARDRVVSVTPLSQELTARADFRALDRLLRAE